MEKKEPVPVMIVRLGNALLFSPLEGLAEIDAFAQDDPAVLQAAFDLSLERGVRQDLPCDCLRCLLREKV